MLFIYNLFVGWQNLSLNLQPQQAHKQLLTACWRRAVWPKVERCGDDFWTQDCGTCGSRYCRSPESTLHPNITRRHRTKPTYTNTVTLQKCTHQSARWTSVFQLIIEGMNLTEWLSNVLHPVWHKMAQFRDVLPSQSLGCDEETKPNTTKANNAGTKRKKYTKNKPKSKENLNQRLTLRTVHVCCTQHSREQFW